MAIIVEDGTGVPGANSYVSVAELESYAADRGIEIIGNPEVLLIKAMDYIETISYCGHKASGIQPLQWPRYGVFVDGYYLGATVIPLNLKQAQMQTALSIDAGVDPSATLPREIKSATVGPVSVTYTDGSPTEIIRSVNSQLKKLICNYNAVTEFKVFRGS